VQIKSKVVVRYRNGRVLKGYTLDFMPNKDVFHVIDPRDESSVTEVYTCDQKAVFYVKTFEGNPDRPGPPDFSEESLASVPGLKLKVTFDDGEVMFGTTNGYAPGRSGFFVFPADKTSNNERVYVFSDSTKLVETWR
jgi:hypothetical protein